MKTYEQIEGRIIQWAIDRRIIPNSKTHIQLLKAFSEMGELADAEAKNRPEEIVDAIGDVMVCLVNYCHLKGLKLTDCMEAAYNEIKDRKGYLTTDGIFIKEE